MTDAGERYTIAISRWEGEGGSEVGPSAEAPDNIPVTDAELMQLRVRAIALENLMIALLVDAPLPQLVVAREMAAYISPRSGYTPHPMTLRAADEILSLLDRADRLCIPPTS